MIHPHHIYIIAARDQHHGIGKSNTLPWKLPTDMAHFHSTTRTASHGKKNMVLMGRMTWDSIPEQHRPLKGRYNVICTRGGNTIAEQQDVRIITDMEQLKGLCDEYDEELGDVYIIGGEQIYTLALTRLKVDGLFVTEIEKTWECDRFFHFDEREFWKKEVLWEGKDGDVPLLCCLYTKG